MKSCASRPSNCGKGPPRCLVALAALALLACNLSAPDTSAGAAAGASATVEGISIPSWEAGKEYRYRVRMTSHLGVGPGSPMVDIDFESQLRLSVLAVSPDGSSVSFSVAFDRVVWKSETEEAKREFADLGALLSRPSALFMNRGAITEIRLDPGLTPFASSISRAVLSNLQVVPPSSPDASKWTANESDSTGRYRAQYERGDAPGRLVKRKLEYREIPVPEGTHTTLRTTVVESTGKILIQNSRLQSVGYRETLSLPLQDGAGIRSETSVGLRLDEVASLGTVPSLSDLRMQTEAVEAVALAGHQRNTASLDRVRIGGSSVDEVINRLERAANGRGEKGATRLAESVNGARLDEAKSEAQRAERKRAAEDFAALAALIRQNPEQVLSRVSGKVRKGSIASSSLIGAMGDANTPRAQSELVAFLLDESLDLRLRMTSALRLLRVKNPTAESADALVSILEHPELKSHATLALGSVSRRLREQGEVGLGNRYSGILARRLKSAVEERDKVVLLQGLTNAADPSSFPELQGLVRGKSSSKVRAGAVLALRWNTDPGVEGVLVAALQDPELNVRRASLRIAKARGYSEGLASAVASAALVDSDVRCRRSAVGLLANWLSQAPHLRVSLERVATSDAHAKVRELAKAAVEET